MFRACEISSERERWKSEAMARKRRIARPGSAASFRFSSTVSDTDYSPSLGCIFAQRTVNKSIQMHTRVHASCFPLLYLRPSILPLSSFLANGDSLKQMLPDKLLLIESLALFISGRTTRLPFYFCFHNGDELYYLQLPSDSLPPSHSSKNTGYLH